ncbi:hypothetical protein DFH07DRAFT_778778 [Mycena maculata]|uniref:Uncharacterized protein n=1 Tax=Mycena maculata TaxID=230809 RepID=A0AAD7IBB5_9AGAR|nr:hypothetical protein DFH07DRAFT_778778 [Mycena maculata]
MSSSSDWCKENTLITPFVPFAEKMNAPVAYDAQSFVDRMAGMHGDLRKGTKKLAPEELMGRRNRGASTYNISPEPESTALYEDLKEYRFPQTPYGVSPPQDIVDIGPTLERVASWTATVAGCENSENIEISDHQETLVAANQEFDGGYMEPVLMGYTADGTPIWNTQVYAATYLLACPDCGFFECPNTTGDYDCPYSTVYDVPDRYDYAGRYGYEGLPVSSNPHGWTFENTGCRLYSLGLRSLTPPAGTEDSGAVEAEDDVASEA